MSNLSQQGFSGVKRKKSGYDRQASDDIIKMHKSEGATNAKNVNDINSNNNSINNNEIENENDKKTKKHGLIQNGDSIIDRTIDGISNTLINDNDIIDTSNNNATKKKVENETNAFASDRHSGMNWNDNNKKRKRSDLNEELIDYNSININNNSSNDINCNINDSMNELLDGTNAAPELKKQRVWKNKNKNENNDNNSSNTINLDHLIKNILNQTGRSGMNVTLNLTLNVAGNNSLSINNANNVNISNNNCNNTNSNNNTQNMNGANSLFAIGNDSKVNDNSTQNNGNNIGNKDSCNNSKTECNRANFGENIRSEANVNDESIHGSTYTNKEIFSNKASVNMNNVRTGKNSNIKDMLSYDQTDINSYKPGSCDDSESDDNDIKSKDKKKEKKRNET